MAVHNWRETRLPYDWTVPPTSPIPKQPVLELSALGSGRPGIPSLLDLPHRMLTRSGRSALLLAFEALDIRPGDEVLLPTYHCPTMIAPAVRLQAIPVFYPITEEGLPNLERLAALCANGPKAMVVAHLFGLPSRLDAVDTFCRSRGIHLIEDCAHAFFGSVNGIPIGSTGEYVIGSLPKFFPVIEGGVLASATRPMLNLACKRQPVRSELRAAWDMIDMAGRHGRLGVVGDVARAAARLRRTTGTTLQATAEPLTGPTDEAIRAEGLADPLLEPMRLRTLESLVIARSDMVANTRRRNLNYHAIASNLDAVPGVRPLVRECGPHAAPYVVPLAIQRPDEAYARMRSAGLPVFRWDRLWPGTPLLPDDAATDWSRGVVQVACHQSLRPGEIEVICRAIEDSVKPPPRCRVSIAPFPPAELRT